MKIKNSLLVFVAIIVNNFTIAQTTPSAEKILDAAKVKAKQENKNILLKFSASWCGWCTKLDAAIHDKTTIALFEKNYVLSQIIVLENAKNKAKENSGGKALLEKYGGNDQGLPYWVIIDANGNVLANSKLKQEGSPLDANGNNVGCPTDDEEINYFMRALQGTSKLETAELAIIKARFKKIATE